MHILVTKERIVMFLNYANSPNDKPEGNMNKNSLLEINSCGTYRLYTKSELPTFRDNGRIDYQLIYLASGKGYFYFDSNTPTVLEAGNMVLYHPQEPQKYIFYAKDQPDVYWIHFTGSDIDELIKGYGINPHNNVIFSSVHPDYINLFKMIIWELQLQTDFFEDAASMYFKQLLIMLGRFNQKKSFSVKNVSTIEIEEAVSYFYEHYSENINVEEYVGNLCISNSSFYRKFKLYTGMTPLQYILDVRMSNAKRLLETTDYSINEIAYIIGYDNSLYFSRLFHKHIGLSPKEYRKFAKNKK